MKTKWKYIGLAAVTLLWVQPGHSGQSPETAKSAAELPELVTDRPDYTESTQTVRPGYVQMEMGVTMAREGSLRHLSQGEILTRVGLLRNLELRLGADGLLSDRAAGGLWTRGVSDTTVGVKIGLREQSRFLPAFSLIPMVSVPTGSGAFSSGAWDPTIKFAWSKDLFAGFTLGGNANYSSQTGDSGRFLQQSYSASLGHDLAAGFTGYWEIYTFAPWDQGTPTAWIANSGVARGIGRNAQFDFRAGSRMTSTGPDWFFGVGFAFRRPTRLFVH